MGLFGKGGRLWGRQAKKSKSRDSSLCGHKRADSYSGAYGADTETQAQKELQGMPAEKAQLIRSCFDRAENVFRQRIIERAERIFGKPLPASVMTLLVKVYFHFAMRGALASAEWKNRRVIPAGEAASGQSYNLVRPMLHLLVEAHPGIASFAAISTAMERGIPLFAELAELSEDVCGSFWKKCVEAAGKALVENGCLDDEEIECAEAEDILESLLRIEGCFCLKDEPDCAARLEACRHAFQAQLLRHVALLQGPAKRSGFAKLFSGRKSDETPGWKYTYCTVRVPGIEKTYAYLSGEGEYVPGDIVDVPFGKENIRRNAEVVAVMRCSASDAPYPPGKTKRIFGKVASAETPAATLR